MPHIDVGSWKGWRYIGHSAVDYAYTLLIRPKPNFPSYHPKLKRFITIIDKNIRPSMNNPA